MGRLVKIGAGWLVVEVDDYGGSALVVRVYDDDGRCVRIDGYYEDDVGRPSISGASHVARRLEGYGVGSEEARAWAEELVEEAQRRADENPDEREPLRARDLLALAALMAGTIGVWLVGVGFLVWLVVMRLF